MKPRLKLTASGKLVLISEGESGFTEDQVRGQIFRHHGTLTAFAKRFDLPYTVVCDATGHPNAKLRAGRVAEVRRLLGLPVQSNPIGLAVVAAYARRSAK